MLILSDFWVDIRSGSDEMSATFDQLQRLQNSMTDLIHAHAYRWLNN